MPAMATYGATLHAQDQRDSSTALVREAHRARDGRERRCQHRRAVYCCMRWMWIDIKTHQASASLT